MRHSQWARLARRTAQSNRQRGCPAHGRQLPCRSRKRGGADAIRNGFHECVRTGVSHTHTRTDTDTHTLTDTQLTLTHNSHTHSPSVFLPSVQRRIPWSALQNSKNVRLRAACFCLPCDTTTRCTSKWPKMRQMSPAGTQPNTSSHARTHMHTCMLLT